MIPFHWEGIKSVQGQKREQKQFLRQIFYQAEKTQENILQGRQVRVLFLAQAHQKNNISFPTPKNFKKWKEYFLFYQTVQ